MGACAICRTTHNDKMRQRGRCDCSCHQQSIAPREPSPRVHARIVIETARMATASPEVKTVDVEILRQVIEAIDVLAPPERIG